MVKDGTEQTDNKEKIAEDEDNKENIRFEIVNQLHNTEIIVISDSDDE